jgi:3-oxoacyl-[acyl-carrier-protein] synthase-1
MARIAVLALRDVEKAARSAVARYGARRVAVILGTSTGGLLATEALIAEHAKTGALLPGYDLLCQHSFNATAELVARLVGAEGPTYTVSTACSSSAKAMAAAARLLDADVIDAALVGGGDSLCRMTLQGFHGLGILAETACRPFDAHRVGMNIGEGAAFQLIERRGDARVHFLGAGESCDAYSVSSPHPEGRGAREAMEGALARQGLSPADVDYINAHGTATPQNDRAEALAIAGLFRDGPLVSSTKGYTGHLLGGAGSTEATFAIHAVLTGRVPATLGCSEMDPGIGPIRIATKAMSLPVRRALSNSFGFGGSNVSLLLGEPA